MSNNLAPIVITPGDPCGIGPDITLALTQHSFDRPVAIIANKAMLLDRANMLDIKVSLVEYDDTQDQSTPGVLQVIDTPLNNPVICQQPDPQHAPYILACLDKAIDMCQSGQAASMVTGPINKAVINDAGIPFSGHTEYLAQKTNTAQVVMMLMSEVLRVALVTTHIPLTQVSQTITKSHLTRVIEILHHDMVNDFGISYPKIALCGLNPHAGEEGHMGDEEIKIIRPVIEKLNTKGFSLSGPIPADTLFVPKHANQYDAILAMYHDQGLAPLKAQYFGEVVNITLGLPFIRTSVDHGTAFDIAGTGKADVQSLIVAIQAAIKLSSCK